MPTRLSNLLFFLLLLLLSVLAALALVQMIRYSDPDVRRNVVIVLGLLFLITGGVIALLSWAVTGRVWGLDRKGMALRHGLWGGIFVVALPLLRWMEALSLLALGAVLLILVGIESLVLLQQEYGDEPAPPRVGEPASERVGEREAPGAR